MERKKIFSSEFLSDLKFCHQFFSHLGVLISCRPPWWGVGVRGGGPGGVAGPPECSSRVSPHVHHVGALHLHHCAHYTTQKTNWDVLNTVSHFKVWEIFAVFFFPSYKSRKSDTNVAVFIFYSLTLKCKALLIQFEPILNELKHTKLCSQNLLLKSCFSAQIQTLEQNPLYITGKTRTNLNEILHDFVPKLTR